MKTIVTGASGFLGKALCSELHSLGHEVIAVVRNENVQVVADKKVCCELKDYSKLSDIIDDKDFDVIYHFAWSGTSGSERGDFHVQLDNIRASCVLAEQCKYLRCKRIVYAASIMEYEISAFMESFS